MQGALSRQGQAGDERRQKKKQRAKETAMAFEQEIPPLVAWVLWLKLWPSATDNLM